MPTGTGNLPVWVLNLDVVGKRTFPLVTIGQKFLLIKEQFFSRLGRKFKIRACE
jgi:hypothetical protein